MIQVARLAMMPYYNIYRVSEIMRWVGLTVCPEPVSWKPPICRNPPVCSNMQ